MNVIMCPKCGKYQASESKIQVKCKYCNSTFKIVSKKGHTKVKVAASNINAREAALTVSQLNQK